MRVRRRGVTVRTRRGYFAFPPGQSAALPYELALANALAEREPPHAFALSVTSTPEVANGGAARIEVTVPLNELRIDSDDAKGAYRAHLSLLVLVKDADGAVAAKLSHDWPIRGPLSDLALERRLNVVQFVSGFEDDSLVFKRYTRETKGLHPRSLSEESWPRVAALPWSEERQRELDAEFAHRYDGTTFLARWNQGWTRQATRGEIVARLDLDAAKKTAVVFSHVLWDANMFYGRDLFEDQEEWFVETVRAACANDAVNWVVKLHPANLWKLRRDGYVGELDEHRAIRERVGDLPAHVRVLDPDNDISTWSLFDVTDYGVTIRGSVGFELPCFGKPVLTAGTGFYSGRGFTIDSATPDEYLERLRTIESQPPHGEREAHDRFRYRHVFSHPAALQAHPR